MKGHLGRCFLFTKHSLTGGIRSRSPVNCVQAQEISSNPKLWAPNRRLIITWVIICFEFISSNPSFNFKYFKQVIAHSGLAWNCEKSRFSEMNEIKIVTHCLIYNKKQRAALGIVLLLENSIYLITVDAKIHKLYA